MECIRLITCDSLTEAYFIKGRLNNSGIECFLTNENFTNLMPMFNNMLGSGIQVFVNEKDLPIAKEIILDKIKPEESSLKCPFCGSKNIGLGIGEKKGFKIISILLAILSAIPLGNHKSKYYCKDCKKEIN